MAKKKTLETGPALEARVQRLFMCQGAFAERGLFLRTVKGASKLVTDIDILAHDYSINLHHTKVYAECKGGRSVSTLDRVIWVRGISAVIDAQCAYLVLDHCDPESVTFARQQNVQIIQGEGLNALESALRISDDFWPGRSNPAYSQLEKQVQQTVKDPRTDEFHSWAAKAADVWRESSAAILTYGKLNSLLACLDNARRFTEDGAIPPEQTGVLKYALAALLVRLCQYVLFATADTLNLSRGEREKHVTDRLTAGNFDIDQTRRLLAGALKLARTKLEEQGVSAPAHWDADHLLICPNYGKPFVELVERVVSEGSKARVLPLTMELRLFGFSGNERGSAGLVRRTQYGLDLTTTVSAFVTQALGLPQNCITGPASTIPGINSLTTGATTPQPQEQSLFPPPSSP
jgi:hypothetical protein